MIRFQVDRWEGSPQDVDSATVAALRVTVQNGAAEATALSEVFDSLVRTVRPYVVVPTYPLARWFLLNWWRLRWEPQRQGSEWAMVHSLAAVDGAHAWPPIEFASDGDYVQVRLRAESAPDAAAIRYLQNKTFEVPADRFEHAIDEFVELVMDRLVACGIQDRTLQELRAELREERSDDALARSCRLQAEAGIHPGEAPDGWLEHAGRLETITGRGAIGEVMAVLPDLGGLAAAQERIEALRTSSTTVDLGWLPDVGEADCHALAWTRGVKLARRLRQEVGLDESSPVSNTQLGGYLSTALPLDLSGKSPLGGALREGTSRAAVSVPTARMDNQRFYLARLIGCALASGAESHLLPVTKAATSLQKVERAFAREFLCPWLALDAFTDERGVDEEGIAEAAEHFQVSEMLVATALVDYKKLPRGRLRSF